MKPGNPPAARLGRLGHNGARHLFPNRCQRKETSHGRKDKEGKVKSHLLVQRRNSRSLHLLSVQMDALLRLQIGWSGDGKDVTRRGGRKEIREPPSWPAGAGSPLSSCCPLNTEPCGPQAQAVASPFLKGRSARAGAVRQSSGPTLRSTALVAAEARKAETTKHGPWVTQAQTQGSARCHHNTQATRAQLSWDALAAHWTTGRQQGLRLARARPPAAGVTWVATVRTRGLC